MEGRKHGLQPLVCLRHLPRLQFCGGKSMGGKRIGRVHTQCRFRVMPGVIMLPILRSNSGQSGMSGGMARCQFNHPPIASDRFVLHSACRHDKGAFQPCFGLIRGSRQCGVAMERSIAQLARAAEQARKADKRFGIAGRHFQRLLEKAGSALRVALNGAVPCKRVEMLRLPRSGRDRFFCAGGCRGVGCSCSWLVWQGGTPQQLVPL